MKVSSKAQNWKSYVCLGITLRGLVYISVGGKVARAWS